MTSTTTDVSETRRRHRTMMIWGVALSTWLIGLSLLLHFVGLGVAWQTGFLTNRMTFDKQQEAERTAEVEKREAERKEQEERERANKELPDEHAKKLKEEAEKKTTRELAKKVEEIKRDYQAVKEVKDRKLAELERRPEEMLRKKLADELAKEAERVKEDAKKLVEKAPVEPARTTEKEADMAERRAKELSDRLTEQMTATDPPQQPAATAANPPAQQQAEAEQRARERVEHTADRLAETAKQASEAAQQAVQQVAEEHRGVAQMLAERAQQLAQKAEQLASDRPLDLTAFNDTSAARRPTELTPEQLEALSQRPPSELYETARQLEEEINRAAADARAAELAMRQNTSLAEALQKVSATTPTRPELGQQLANANPQTVAQLNEHRAALDEAVTQAESMRLAAQSQSTQVGAMSPAQQGAPGMEQESRYAQMLALGQAAGQRGQNLDISRMMRMNSFGGTAGGDNSIIFDDSNQELGGEEFDLSPSEMAQIRIDKKEVVAQALPGRKFDKESARQGWLYLDTWYVIGPFENEGRLDYTRVHPPESEINFDAVYDGKQKDGKPRELRWQFTQSEMIRVTPPDEQSNSTYYAFTELYFEDDTDMLVAIATDDAAKVWINDQIVWEDQGLSPWNIGEGFRKVFFHRGYNKILIRIENGPVVCQFSMVICPPEVVASAK